MKKNISVIILTYNENKHLERCIRSVLPFAETIFVVDSYSADNTVQIATSLGSHIYQNKWVNYATQFNWGLDHCPINTEWVMRMDADEYVTSELSEEIKKRIAVLDSEITGVFIKRRVYFMNRWIKNGGYYPTWLLRIWRFRKGYCENRWMDEHIKVNGGKSVFFENDIVDDNLNNLSWWIDKHNSYATREMIDLLNIRYNFLHYDEVTPELFGSQEKRKRWLKIMYASFPLFTRPFIYFIYRYFIKLGFLDGKKGLIWHFLQGFWYRFLVDAKIYDVKRRAKSENKNIKSVLEEYIGKPL